MSENMVMGELKEPKTSKRRLLSQRPSFILCVAMTYSLSVVDSETISSHLDNQNTVPLSMRNA